MLTPEELEDAYTEGWNRSVLRNMRRPGEADHNAAGLLAVAHLQAKHDAKIAKDGAERRIDAGIFGYKAAAMDGYEIASAIMTQFEPEAPLV